MAKQKLTLSITAILFAYVLVSAAFCQEAQGAKEQAVFAGKINGSCFSDVNQNGKKDAGETGVGGITVSLKRLAFFLFPQDAGTATAGADGSYEFTGLRPGLYLAQVQNNSAAECKTKNPLLAWLGFFKNTQTADFGFVISAPAPTVSISAEPLSINRGQSATLTWSSENVDTAGIDQGIGSVALQGTLKVSPEQTTSYTITAQGKGGTAQASVTVTVTIPEPVTTTPTTIITATTSISSSNTTSTAAGGGGGGGGGGSGSSTTTAVSSTTTSALLTTSSTTTTAAVNTNIPNVIGLSQSAAETAITTAGFIVGTVITQNNSTVASGHVVSQYPYPLPGAVAAAGSAVNLVVSLGPGSVPVVTAPSLDTSVATNVISATAFLYTGQNPVQTGVAPGAIAPRQVAVLKGTVTARDDGALSGVAISILNHPDYGQTLSRADGTFDMAVNGGGLMTIIYSKTGYLTAQRQINVPWQDYVALPDVALIPLDAAQTPVDLTQTGQSHTATGSTVSDSSGTRQVKLYFPAGVHAWLVKADGSEQAANTLTVRATEYTVGTNGPEAMPAELPPTSFYTYAVELSANEAPPPEFTGVRFSDDIYTYIDNFLNFPIGTRIPSGSYDFEKAAWVPYTDGRVIKILSITGGLAVLDTDGDGNPDNALGITNDELQQLAYLYPSPTSAGIWRMPMNHFTPKDCNLPVVTLTTEQDPQPQPAQPEGTVVQNSNTNNHYGSIDFQNRMFGEQAPVTGTPFSLHYSSDRMPGRTVNSSMIIPLCGDTIPSTLKRIELKVEVAGKVFPFTFQPADIQPNLVHHFTTWDGIDAYGRAMQGAQPVTIKIGYVYDGYYAMTPDVAASFGLTSGEAIAAGLYPARREVIRWHEQRASINAYGGALGGWDARAMGFGGWTLNVHHAYDPGSHTLYLGDGRQSGNQVNLKRIINTVAGSGCYHDSCGGGIKFSGDGGPATNAQLDWPLKVAFGPDGSYYIADYNNKRIRKVSPDGIITTVAGGNNNASYDPAKGPCPGDGGPGTEANLYYPTNIAIGKDNSLYVLVTYNALSFIRKIDPSGIITTIAGSWTSSGTDSGVPATSVQLISMHMALGPDGTLYIPASSNRIQRIGPDGLINTIAGTGAHSFSGDNGPALQASFDSIYDIAAGPDGSLYVADTNRVRRIRPDGLITTVAGTGVNGNTGDGGNATDAKIWDDGGIAVGPDNTLYISGQVVVRRVGTDGIITTVAGTGIGGYSGDGGPSPSAKMDYIYSISVAPDGSLFLVDEFDNRIRQVGGGMPGFSGDDIALAAEDGSMVYQFDRNGRHLKTVHAMTGATMYAFSYDARNLLVKITDGDGNETIIERDGAGKPAAIVAPFGQHTTFTLNADGYLTSITNPASEAMQLGYATGGLLTSVTGPRGTGFTYTANYDADGNLVSASDPAGGSDTLTRTSVTDGYQVTGVTGMGITSTYMVKNLKTGDQQLQNTLPDGTMITTVMKTDGTRTFSIPAVTDTSIVTGPDPRFFMQAPVTQRSTISTPGGKKLTAIMTRSVQLKETNNPLIISALTDTYSINGRIATSVYDAAARTYTGTSPGKRQTIKKIDTLGRVTQITVAGLSPVNFSYDTWGRLSSIIAGSGAAQRSTTFTYDSTSGYPNAIINAITKTTQFVCDAAGRRTQATLPNGSVINYAYDAHGNMTSLTPPDRPPHTFSYNEVDLRSEYTPVPGFNTSYAYNKDRQLTRITKPGGISVNYAYDAAKGRRTSITHPDGTIGFSYNTAGMISMITATSGVTVTAAYDGALLTSETLAGTVAGTVSRTYDNDFRVSSLSITGGAAPGFTYDSDSLLTKAGDITINRIAQNGLLTGTALGEISDSFSYNEFGEPASYSAAYIGTALYAAQYSHDKLGRISQITETIKTVSDTFNNSTHEYSYDSAGRLSAVKKDNIVTASYTYDGNGNRNPVPGGGTYDAQDRMTSYGSTTYDYAGSGEIKSKTVGSDTTTYDYDALGNLLDITLPDTRHIQYIVDGLNRRVGKKVNGTLEQGFLYIDQLHPIAELDGSNNVVSTFIYGSRSNVPDYMVNGGGTYRIISDHLGSPRLVVNTQTGVIAQRMDYDEFGRVTQDTSPGFQPFGFAGGLYDHDTELVRFGARDYDPEIGRWTAKDPLLFNGGSANLYVYALNDPVNMVDPSGLGPNWGTVGTGLWQVTSGLGGLFIGFGLAVATEGAMTLSPWFYVGAVNGGVSVVYGIYNFGMGFLDPSKPPAQPPVTQVQMMLINEVVSHVDTAETTQAQIQWMHNYTANYNKPPSTEETTQAQIQWMQQYAASYNK